MWNLMALPLMLSLVEGVLFLLERSAESSRNPLEYVSGYHLPHPDLGFVPKAGGSYPASMKDRKTGQDIYRVEYGIGEDGLRVTPRVASQDWQTCAAFLGCSFTFGEGLQDDQTLPYFFEKTAGPAMRSYNFGFHGYGPHHVLSGLETGWVKSKMERCEGKKVLGYLTTARFHIPRVVGKVFWDKVGPWYRLENNKPVRKGTFVDQQNYLFDHELPDWAGYQLQKSLLFQKIKNLFLQKDTDLYLAILKTSKEAFDKDFPESEFKIVFWPTLADRNEKADLELMQKIEAQGLTVLNVEKMIPDLRAHPEKYQLSDSHPSAEANQLIAKALVESWEHQGQNTP